MDTEDETLEPLEGKTPEEAEEIIEIAEDHGIDLEQAKEVKELAEELDIDIDEAVEINDAL